MDINGIYVSLAAFLKKISQDAQAFPMGTITILLSQKIHPRWIVPNRSSNGVLGDMDGSKSMEWLLVSLIGGTVGDIYSPYLQEKYHLYTFIYNL